MTATTTRPDYYYRLAAVFFFFFPFSLPGSANSVWFSGSAHETYTSGNKVYRVRINRFLLLLFLLLFVCFVLFAERLLFLLQFDRYFCSSVQCCFTSTEIVMIVRDGEPRTATLTFTQLLSSEVVYIIHRL